MSVLRRLAPLCAVLALTPLLYGFDPFTTRSRDVEEGNAKLKAGKPEEALEAYDRAAKALPDEPGVQYNRGIALNKLGKFEEARQALVRATEAGDAKLKSQAFYNLGNTLMEEKKFEDAAAAYISALRQHPGHEPSKWNLEMALRQIKEQEKNKDKNKDDKQQDQKDQQQDKQDQKDQKQQQDQQKNQKEDQKKNEPKPGEQKQDQEQEKQGQKEPQPEPQQKKPDEQEREQVLDALDQSDKNLQKERARALGQGRRKPAKDW